MTENKRFYTTRHHHESGSYKMVHDKSERFSFPRATRDSDLFLHCMNTLAEENEELKEELTEQVNRKDACLKTTHSFNMKIKRLEKENEQLKKENKELKRRYELCKFRRANNLNYIHDLECENEQLKQQLASKEKAHERCDKLYWRLYEKNEQLKQELSEYKDYVFSDNEILCYSCVNCLEKGIYEVECSEKGKVDVHGSCFSYWKNEVEE